MPGSRPPTSPADRPRGPSRKVVATVAVVLVVGGLAGTVAALTFTSLGTQYISLFSSLTAASRFSIGSYTASVTGLDVVVVAVGLTNTDTASHNASVYVSLENASAVQLVNGTQSTGVILGGVSTTLTYTFTQTNLAVNYDRTFISVQDVS